ncbi:MAG: hypothetical protein RIQ47_1033 [Bacteroidota bacterium]|jgi:capsular polysaccharide biosynthesis protein
MNPNTNPIISSGELLLALSQKKWRYSFLLIFIFTAGVFFFRYTILSYTSTTTLVVIDGLKQENRNTEKQLPDFLLPSDQFNRVLQVVNSSEMYDHLIKKFNLYHHYSIEENQEFHYEKAIRKLRSCIEAKKTPYNSISITVSDRYRYVAFEMANEIAVFANELNRKQLEIIQRKRVAVYEKTNKILSDRLTLQKRGLDSLLARLPQRESTIINAAENELQQSVNRLGRTLDDYSALLREQLFILEALRDVNAPTIVQQQKALQDGNSLLLPAIGCSILTTILFAFILVFITYFKLHYKEQLAAFRNKKID